VWLSPVCVALLLFTPGHCVVLCLVASMRIVSSAHCSGA
jgi:hypothetical protein